MNCSLEGGADIRSSIDFQPVATKTALVSIAIPAFNHAQFIEACLASVCAQTYPELELVLIDDGSTDGTFEIAQRFLAPHQERFRRIVLEKRENQGVSANSNACIEACQGEWVHLLGSDDVLYPNKIERIQQSIADWNCPNLGLVHADCDYIGEDGKPVVRSRQKSRPPPGPDFKAYRWLFVGEHYIFNPTIALHRQTFLALDGFDRSLPLEDLDCWLRLSISSAIARVPEVLASYRKHPGNSSRKRLKMLSALFDTYAKFLATHPGLLDDQDICQNFRLNVWRFWKRTRGKNPWAIFAVVVALLKSRWNTPNAKDFKYFAIALNKAQS